MYLSQTTKHIRLCHLTSVDPLTPICRNHISQGNRNQKGNRKQQIQYCLSKSKLYITGWISLIILKGPTYLTLGLWLLSLISRSLVNSHSLSQLEFRVSTLSLVVLSLMNTNTCWTSMLWSTSLMNAWNTDGVWASPYGMTGYSLFSYRDIWKGLFF